MQIAFIKDEEFSNKLSEDINEMEKMLNEYLQFTSSSYLEKDEEFNISDLANFIFPPCDLIMSEAMDNPRPTLDFVSARPLSIL